MVETVTEILRLNRVVKKENKLTMPVDSSVLSEGIMMRKLDGFSGEVKSRWDVILKL